MLIAFCGSAGSGKDTAGAAIAAEFNMRTYAMAKPMKAMLSAIGIDEPERERKEMRLPGFEFSYRKASQALGTEWGRHIDPDLWVKLAEREYRKSDQHMVVTDIRFVNEVKFVRACGGVLIKITGREAELGIAKHHASEWGIPDELVDMTIHNNSTLEQFKYSTVQLVGALLS